MKKCSSVSYSSPSFPWPKIQIGYDSNWGHSLQQKPTKSSYNNFLSIFFARKKVLKSRFQFGTKFHANKGEDSTESKRSRSRFSGSDSVSDSATGIGCLGGHELRIKM